MSFFRSVFNRLFNVRQASKPESEPEPEPAQDDDIGGQQHFRLYYRSEDRDWSDARFRAFYPSSMPTAAMVRQVLDSCDHRATVAYEVDGRRKTTGEILSHIRAVMRDRHIKNNEMYVIVHKVESRG